MFYATERNTGKLVWLFNIEADYMDQAITRGKSLYKRYPQDSVIQRFYSLRYATARPMNKWNAEQVSYRRED